MAEYRTVTILYTKDDVEWCKYLMAQFKSDELNINIETINVTDYDYEDRSEIQTAVRESYTVVLLTTFNFLEYMKKQQRRFAQVIQTRDKSITTVVAATIDVSSESLQEVTSASSYNSDRWTTINVLVNGRNIKKCITQILDIADTNAETLAKRLSIGKITDSALSRGYAANEDFEIIPHKVQEKGEKVAIIFLKEQAEGSVTVRIGEIEIPIETVNPYCVTFVAPEIKETQITVQVDMTDSRQWQSISYNKQPKQFTSVQLMCQTYGVNNENELDEVLAEKFTSSMCPDQYATTIFSKSMPNSRTGRHDSQYPTLLHWAAANGLRELCSAVLPSVGGLDACHIQNCDGDDVADLAEKNNHYDLLDFISDFTETMEAVATCDLYVKSMDTTSILQEHKYTSKHMTAYGARERKLDSLKVNLSPPLNTRPMTLPELECPTGKDETYVIPDHMLTWKSSETGDQQDFIEIQRKLSSGSFSVKSAQILSDSWMAQYQAGNDISFADKMKAQKTIREQHKNILEVLTAVKPEKSKKEKKKDSGSSNDQEVFGVRKKLGTLLKLKLPGDGKRGNLVINPGSSPRTPNCDSGIWIPNVREGALSQSSFEEAELDDVLSHMRVSKPQHERAVARKSGNRISMRDRFLQLSERLSNVSQSCPPPLPPRKYRTQAPKQQITRNST